MITMTKEHSQELKQTKNINQREDSKVRSRSDADLLRMIMKNHKASGIPITAELLQSYYRNLKGQN